MFVKDEEKKEFGRWWMWLILLIAGAGIVFTLLGYAGKVGGTIVERKVFENSYQRSESLKSREAAYEAQLAQIDSRLAYCDPESDLYAELSAQKAMLQVQIRQTREMK